MDKEDNDAVFEYIDMSLNKLKLLAKDRGLLEYNNLQKDELIQALKQKDNCSWRELVKTMRDLLKTSQYDQIPQFSSGLFENIDAPVFI